MSIFSLKLTAERAIKLVNSALKKAEAESQEAAWLAAQPLIKALPDLYAAADGTVHLINAGAFEQDNALEAAAIIVQVYSVDPGIMGRLGEAFQALTDVRYLNAAPPADPVLLQIAEALLRFEQANNWVDDDELTVLRGLSTAARILGRSWDAAAERCAKRLVELNPDSWVAHYNLGLFYKTRGRFQEGSAANQRAFDKGGATDESVQWNLGICATGAGDGERALQVWKSFGHEIELGRFGLPDGNYREAKVRLAQHPIAERDPDVDGDDPGLEESVWIERISPCHGIIRSALFQELGVDYGDAVLFDGAPITYHESKGERFPVFPHLATLVRPGYRMLPFGGTQQQPGQVVELSAQLPADAVLYPHTEYLRFVCQQCWEGRAPHQHHADEPEHRIVTGKLCIPPHIHPAELLVAIDSAVAQTSGVQLFIPALAEAAGDLKRAEIEARRLAMISETA